MFSLLCYYNRPQLLVKTVKTEIKQAYQQTENKQPDWHQIYD